MHLGRWLWRASACLAVVMSTQFPAWGAEWDVSLSGYGGLSHPPNRDLGVAVPGVLDITGQNVSLKDSAVLGAKLSLWSLKAQRVAPVMNFGIELEALQFRPNVKSQTVNASGTLFGVPSTGTLTFLAPLDLQTGIVAVNFLVRYSFNVTPDLPNGRWYVYFGPGGGAQRTRLRQPGLGDQQDTAPMVQGLIGLKFFLARHISLFGEYKYTHAHQHFDSGPVQYSINLDSNLFIGGASIHF
jgi:hypothetical protein